MVEALRVANGDFLDRDLKFTSGFWRHLFRKVGKKLRFTMAFLSQTVGKMEHVMDSLTNT